MKFTLPPPISRMLAGAILLALFAIVYYGIAAPVVDAYQSTDRSIARFRADLIHYEQAGATLATRRAQLAALRRRGRVQDGFLQGTSETLAAARIQNRLKRLVEAARGQLQSTDVLVPQQEGSVRRITVRALMSAPLGSVLHVFYGLESGSPYLFLDNVDIRARPIPFGRSAAEMHEGTALDVQFDIYGYMRGKNSKPAPSLTHPAESP